MRIEIISAYQIEV